MAAMKLHYSGSEHFDSPPEKVWKFVCDPEKVASCLPDVQRLEIIDENNFDAVVKVGIGPIKGKFKLSIGLYPDRAKQHMVITLKGKGLGNSVDLTAASDIVGRAGGTQLDWQGTADIHGPVARLGGKILDGKADELIKHVFADVNQRIKAD